MKTLKIELYNFNEISEEAREKAKRNYIERNRESIQYFVNEMFSEDLPCRLEQKETLFTNPQFEYSLSYCQGDGFSFSFNLDILDYLNKYFPNLKDSVKNVISNNCYFLAEGNKSRYTYASANNIDLCLEYHNIDNYPNLDSIINSVLEHIQDNYLQICSELEEEGYKAIYDWEDDEDYILDKIRNAEETEPIFLSNGEIY